MYRPKYFTETNEQIILEFMQQNPFATIICHDGNKNYATQIPIIVEVTEGKTILKGHISRHTDHYPVLEQSNEVLVMFTGPHCYVSASWYAERGQASTWNYMTVQATGKINMLSAEASQDLLQQLTHQYENSQEQPELMENMDDNYIRNNVKAIAGFAIEVTNLEATFKLSQNRSDKSYKNVVEKLEESDDYQGHQIANELKKRKPNLF